MRYCGCCHFDLEGLAPNAQCPECGAYDRIAALPKRFQRLRKLLHPIAVSFYVFAISFGLFVYGEGPFTIAGNGSIRLGAFSESTVRILMGTTVLFYLTFCGMYLFYPTPKERREQRSRSARNWWIRIAFFLVMVLTAPFALFMLWMFVTLIWI